jgi:hypothetical protein
MSIKIENLPEVKSEQSIDLTVDELIFISGGMVSDGGNGHSSGNGGINCDSTKPMTSFEDMVYCVRTNRYQFP